MGRLSTSLTDTKIKRAKPKDKRYKLSDGRGLYLYVYPSGVKSWKYRYRFDGKEQELTIGEYPSMSLAEARKAAQELGDMVKRGLNPKSNPKLNPKSGISEPQKTLFKHVADEFLKFKEHEYSASHFLRQAKRVEQYILPLIGDKGVDEITKKDIIEVVRNVPNVKTRSAKQSDKLETARRIFTIIKQIYRYGIHNDLIKEDVPSKIDINAVLPKGEGGRLKALTDEDEIRAAFKLITTYDGDVTRLALEFLALSALRPGNVRNMQWEWVNLKKKVVEFPKEAMKTKAPYRLPLTKRMIEILKEIQKFTKGKGYVFCSPIAPSKPMSENTLNYAHKRIGLENHNAHGWRSSFSTICYEKQREHGYGYEVIESQLAHKVGNSVKMAYLRSDFLEERRGLLEWWEWFLRG